MRVKVISLLHVCVWILLFLSRFECFSVSTQSGVIHAVCEQTLVIHAAFCACGWGVSGFTLLFIFLPVHMDLTL